MAWGLSSMLALTAAGTVTNYVSASGRGARTGATWRDATDDLQAAIEACAAAGGGEVWVSGGVYKPNSWPNGTVGARGVHFSLRNGVTVYGGFRATGVPQTIEQRDPRRHVTRLSGDIGVSRDRGDNAYHVFFHPSNAMLNASAVLDGVWIEYGRADGRGHWFSGGGMYNDFCSPKIVNTVFDGNYAGGEGGGMRGGVAENCTFVGNSAGTGGGAADVWVVSGSRFMNNVAYGGGGGLFAGGWGTAPVGSSTVVRCEFIANEAGSGGGMVCDQGSVISHCTFSRNRATASGGKGGGVHTMGGLRLLGIPPIRIEHCLFDANSAVDPTDDGEDSKGGGVYTFGDFTIANCTFVNNGVLGAGEGRSHAYDGGGLYSYYYQRYNLFDPEFFKRGVQQVVNCVFMNNHAESHGGALGCADAQVDVLNCVITRNRARRGGGLCPNEPGVAARYRTDFDVRNSIVRYNHADRSGYENLYIPGERGVFNKRGRLYIRYSNVTYRGGGWDGEGNQTGHVSFVDSDYPAGPDGEWLTDDDGLRLSSSSPCIDAGDPDMRGSDRADIDGDGVFLEPLPLDGVGHVRVHNGVVDLGPYEFGASSVSAHIVDFDLVDPDNGERGAWVGGGALRQTVVHESPADTPEVECEDGWVLSGWSRPFDYVTTDLAVTARYSRVVVTHRVFFRAGEHGTLRGWIWSRGEQVEHGEAVSVVPTAVPDPGWYFSGWDVPFDPVTNDLTVTAKYRPVSPGSGNTCYVKEGASGHGSSWADAVGDLQAAIETVAAAGTGQVWVAAGTYEPTFCLRAPPGYLAGKGPNHFSLRNSVTVYGGFPAEGTPGMGARRPSDHRTICDGTQHVFWNWELDDSAVLDGVTITGGNATGSRSWTDLGGGMFNDRASPTLRSCVFATNSAMYGGGLYNGGGSSPMLRFCRFIGNTADRGGGVYNLEGAPTFTNCVFEANEADRGGGMANIMATPILRGCLFDGNTADHGGGMANEGGMAMLTRCLFDDNSANHEGGGMWNAGAAPSLVSCVFHDCRADDGAGMGNETYAAPSVVNCVFYDNEASRNGGAMHNYGDVAALLAYCTLVGNSASSGGGVYGWNVSHSLTNCVLWSNSGGSFFSLASSSTVSHCIIEGGFSGSDTVLDADPLFERIGDPDGADNDWFTDDDGLRLQGLSPGVNTGVECLLYDLNDVDADGNTAEILPLDIREAARQLGVRPDMGAYERLVPETHTVRFHLGAHGTNVGGGALTQTIEHHGAAIAPVLRTDLGWALTGWDVPFGDITGDIDTTAQYGPAFSADDICYVCEGGDDNGTSWARAAGDPQAAIEAIAAAGGGQVWIAAGTFLPNSHPNGGSGAREQHFALRNSVRVYGGFPGSGNPGMPERDPGRFPTVFSADLGIPKDPDDNAYHVFHHPDGAALGAGAVLDGVTIAAGNADGGGDHGYGGGMRNNGASPSLTRCVLLGNAAKSGGGIANRAASPALVGCVFAGNTATTWGGGLYNAVTSSPTIVNSVFSGNSATDGGGLLNDSSCTSRLDQCTFAGNAATGNGGGLANGWGGDLAVRGSVLWGNTAAAGPALYAADTAQVHVAYCVVEGGWTGGTEVITANPLYADPRRPAGLDGLWLTADDGLRLRAGSPGANAGDTSGLPADSSDVDADGDSTEPLPMDILAGLRVIGGEVDLGAYETVLVDTGLSPVHYVSTVGGNTWPYTNWATAARVIQYAVDAASAGDTVLVTNGWYDAGCGSLTSTLSRVCVTAAVVVSSVNGADETWIAGAADPQTGGLGTNAVRCVHLVENAGAKLSGFSLTNGYTTATSTEASIGGGVLAEKGNTASDCVMIGNSAVLGGGMTCWEVSQAVSNCVFVGNSAERGGGAYCYLSSTLNNCWFVDNVATGEGGGAHGTSGSVLNNCLFVGNTAGTGGGTFHDLGGYMNNCTVSGNSASDGSGCAAFSAARYRNCIVYYNTGGGDDLSGNYIVVANSCSPGLTNGVNGNINKAPDFVNPAAYDYHLQGASPCINAGANGVVQVDVDLDGGPRIVGGTVDMGCYEHVPEHLRPTPAHYVSPYGSDTYPYTSWATAAHVIQDAVDVAMEGDTVLVSNGVYAVGGRVGPRSQHFTRTLTNRVCITNGVTVQSVNGPEYATILGAGPAGASAVRCAFVGDGASLEGFTLNQGHTDTFNSPEESGGGAYLVGGGRIANCVLSGNEAQQWGGGVYCYKGGMVSSCLLSGNVAIQKGGGSAAQQGGALVNCTVVSNRAGNFGGGGVYANGGSVSNCIIYGNTAVGGANPNIGGTLSVRYSCCPDVTHGSNGNINEEPNFVSLVAGDYHLAPGSPCIDVGHTAAVVDATDLDGHDRAIGDGVDIGCYEYPSTAGHAMHYAQHPGVSGWNLAAPISGILLDDFLSMGGDITQISFWGAWESNIVGMVTGVVLRIYADNEESPGEVLWTGLRRAFSLTEVTLTSESGRPVRHANAERHFRCDVSIPVDQAFFADDNTRYWLSMSVLTVDGTWSWRSSGADSYGSDALWWDADSGTWADVPDSPAPGALDLAFEVRALEDDMVHDYGDAAATGYPVLAVSNGAWHAIVPGSYLGSGIDGEPDGQPDDEALGDDSDLGAGNPEPNFDDDDGVQFEGRIVAGRTAAASVVAGPNGGKLDAWIDFGADGSWDDPEDQVLSGHGLSGGTNDVSIPIVARVEPGVTYARFRLSSGGGLGPSGPAADGEVEDYRVMVYQPAPSGGIAFIDVQVGDEGRERRVFWNAQSNIVYQVQTASNLVPVAAWRDLGDRVHGPMNSALDAGGSATSRYYRVIVPYVAP